MTGPSADTIDSYSFFIVGVLHLICSGVIGIGGIYHSIPGPIRLEETIHAYIFGYAWQDRTRITSILGAHLCILGSASLLLFGKGVYFGGVYDTWASGGGDIRLIKYTTICLNPYILGRYFLSA